MLVKKTLPQLNSEAAYSHSLEPFYSASITRPKRTEWYHIDVWNVANEQNTINNNNKTRNKDHCVCVGAFAVFEFFSPHSFRF